MAGPPALPLPLLLACASASFAPRVRFRATLIACTPKNDFCLIDLEAGGSRRVQSGSHRAGTPGGDGHRRSGSRSGPRIRRLHTAHQTGTHACREHVVDGLRRHRTQRFADLAGDLVRGRMRLGRKGFQNSNPRRGHPQSGGPQHVPGIEVTRRGHPSSYTPFLESVKKSRQGRAGAVVLGAPGACGGSGGWKPGPPGPNGPEAGGRPNSPRGPIGNIGGPPRWMIAKSRSPPPW